MKTRIYHETFKIVSEAGKPEIRFFPVEIERDQYHGHDIRMDFRLEHLDNEIEHLPAYLKEQFGNAAGGEDDPDMILLRRARAALVQKNEEIAAKLLPHLLQHLAVEAQIEQASRLSPNTPDRSLYDIVAEPVPPSPQPE